MFNPYYDTCRNLGEYADGLSLHECIRYIEDNPGVTEQDVLDYHAQRQALKLDEFLASPIVP